MTFWVWLVNSFQKARVETSLFQDYILDDALDNETPNGDYINDDYIDDYDYENHINGSNGNNDHNHHNNYNHDDNDNNFDNDNGDQTIVIFQGNPFWRTFCL